MKQFRSRWFIKNIESALKVMPVTVVTGARQTGKTTLVKSIGADRAYFTLDEVGVLDQADKHPDALLHSRPITLGEVQRTPPLLLAVKRAVDERRQSGDFLLTGSANLLLMGRVADTLAGRAIYLELPPFCPSEWRQRKNALSPLDRLFAPDFDFREWPAETGNWPTWLLRGGYPPALALDNDSDRSLWLSAYVQTYLERDLRQLTDVSSLPDFQRVMALAAHRTGRLLNQAEVARDAALTHPTTHRYLNLLETGCLVTRIRPFATNPNVALVKTPKLLWTDCGLAALLAGIKKPAEATARPDSGFWLEQTLYQTLQTWRALEPLQRKIYFWRDRPGREVDFILEQNGQLVALEIKSGSAITTSDASGIRAFRDSLKKNQVLVRSVILHAGQSRPLDTDILALPWGWMVPAE